MAGVNDFDSVVDRIDSPKGQADFYNLKKLEAQGRDLTRLPYSIRIILENAVRNSKNVEGAAESAHGLLDWPSRQRNTIRYTFLHPEARNLYPDWEQKARGCVAQLRAVAGSDPDAPDLAALVGELLVKSPDFGRMWGRYEVRRAGAGDRIIRHPLVGTLRLAHETLGLNRADGQCLIVYLAAPGTPDHDAMVLLDSADLTGTVVTGTVVTGRG